MYRTHNTPIAQRDSNVFSAQELRFVSDREKMSSVASNAKAKRLAITFSVKASARDVLENLREETGIPNAEALARVLEWFASQEPALRLAILNRRPEVRTALLAPLMAKVAHGEDLDDVDEDSLPFPSPMPDMKSAAKVRPPGISTKKSKG